MKKMKKAFLIFTIISIILTSSLTSISAVEEESKDMALRYIGCAEVEGGISPKSGVTGFISFFGIWGFNIRVKGTVYTNDFTIIPKGASKISHNDIIFEKGDSVDLHITFILFNLITSENIGRTDIWGRAFGVTIN